MSTPTNPLAPQDIGNGLTSDVFGQQSMASPPVKPGAVKSFLAQMFQGAADAGAAHLGLPTSFDRQQAAIKNQQQKQALDQKGQEMQAEAARWTAMAQQIQAQSTPVAYADDFAEDFGLPKGGQMPQSAYTALAKVRETAKAKLGAAQIGAGARIGAAQIGQGINPASGQSNTPGTLGDVLGSDHPLAGMPLTKFSLGLANAMLTAQGKNKRLVNANGRITLQDIGQVPAGTDFGAATGTLMPGISAKYATVPTSVDGQNVLSTRAQVAGAAQGGAPMSMPDTAQMRNVGAQARVAAEGIPNLITEIDSMKNDLGPMMGRWNDFMQGKIGNDNPKFAGLRADMLMASSAVALAHARGRLPENLREEFDNAINAPQQTAENLKAVLTHILPWMQRMQNIGGTPQGGKPAPTGRRVVDLTH